MPRVQEAAFQVVALSLQELSFERLEGAPPEGKHETPVEFGLSVGDPSSGSLPIRLAVTIDERPAYRLRVVYGAVFRPTEDAPDENREASWRIVAARLAPTILYPFIRETIATVLQKAGLPALIAPVINFASLLPPEEIVFARAGETAELAEPT